MTAIPIDLSSLVKALAQLHEAVHLWHEELPGSVLKRHLCSSIIHSSELTYALSVRLLRSALIARSESAELVIDLSFNDLLSKAGDAGLVTAPDIWRQWNELRNLISHTHDESKATEVAAGVERFAAAAVQLLAVLEKDPGP
jgi:nucleotidyltransferase substrate binding protein (TIGR01987 family)